MAEIEGTTEGGDDVTFVNGVAVDQTTEGDVPEEGTDHGDERAAAIAAVKKALAEDAKEEGKKAAKEAKAAREKDPLVPRDRDANGQFIQNDPVEAEKEAAVKALKKEQDDDASALKKALAERKETARFKREASEQLEKERNEVRTIYARVQQQERQLKEQEARLAKFRTDPVAAIRANGWDKPEDFILDIARDGTPEGQAARAQRELLARLEAAENWQKQELQQRQQQSEQAKRHQALQAREQVERGFLAEASKHEALVDMYKGYETELIGQADIVADQYRAATGKEATAAEIAEYIAERHERWYKNRSSKVRAKDGAGDADQGSRRQAPVTQGRPTQGSATGKKSLSPAGSSERRSLGANFADLDGDERRDTAIAAVKAAIHASGER